MENEKVLIGGNHLANVLLGHGVVPSETASPDDIDCWWLRDVWIAWRAIMDYRNAPQQSLAKGVPMSTYSLDKVNLDRVGESIWRWLAWKLPRRLVMWAAVRAVAFATQGKYDKTIVPELSAIEAVKRWDMG